MLTFESSGLWPRRKKSIAARIDPKQFNPFPLGNGPNPTAI